ncbi:retrovirus-related pol polyprotein from transposon TNT 1-94 [Tanacetum coccineum]
MPEPDVTYSSPSMPKQETTSDDPIPEPEFLCFSMCLSCTYYSNLFQGRCKRCRAIDDELRALKENNTWEVTYLPVDKKAIPCHWIYKIKLKADGSLDRKKARLVISVMNGWNTCQIDVSNAFLHGDLTEKVYMQMPQGYVGKGEKVQDTSSSLVCRLKKSLYGLKQAPRQWFAKLSSALLSFGFVQSKVDYSLFIKSNTSSFITILVYVDDLLITGSSQDEIQHLKSQLSELEYDPEIEKTAKRLRKEARKRNFQRGSSSSWLESSESNFISDLFAQVTISDEEEENMANERTYGKWLPKTSINNPYASNTYNTPILTIL